MTDFSSFALPTLYGQLRTVIETFEWGFSRVLLQNHEDNHMLKIFGIVELNAQRQDM